MLLNRIGNKKVVVKHMGLLDYFPQHELFIDLFFGGGGLFFNKPKAKYNICNDFDSEIYNLFQVVKNQKEELVNTFNQMPIHNDLWNHWKKSKETESLWQAVRFLFLSNFGFMGKPDTLKFGIANSKEILLKNIEKTFDYISKVQFMNCDFREVLDKIGFSHIKDKSRSFIYADPPYLNTDNNYPDNCQFQQKDTEDLFEMLVNSGIRFAISEFDNEVVLNLAKSHRLNVHEIGSRKNLGKRRNEILVTNYKISNLFN